jgi:Alg9-like mannosyltransferase family
VDSVAYRRFQIVPINIVLYNVFSDEHRGPNLYGTEPWWYYVFNLLLNFNVMSLMALCSLPLLVFSNKLPLQLMYTIDLLEFPSRKGEALDCVPKQHNFGIDISVDWDIHHSAA